MKESKIDTVDHVMERRKADVPNKESSKNRETMSYMPFYLGSLVFLRLKAHLTALPQSNFFSKKTSILYNCLASVVILFETFSEMPKNTLRRRKTMATLSTLWRQPGHPSRLRTFRLLLRTDVISSVALRVGHGSKCKALETAGFAHFPFTNSFFFGTPFLTHSQLCFADW